MTSEYTLLNDEPDELETFVDELLVNIYKELNPNTVIYPDKPEQSKALSAAKSRLLIRLEQEYERGRQSYAAEVSAKIETAFNEMASIAKSKENTNAN